MFEKQRKFHSRRREVRELKRRVFFSSAAALSVLVLGVAVWYVARLPEVTIASVTVSGGETVSHEIIKAKAESVLSGTYVLLIPRRFSFLYPESEIVNALNAIPRVHNAAVIKASRTELEVTFEEYVPFALWCESVPEASSTPPRCAFLNEEGYAFADAPSLVGETLMRFVIAGRSVHAGEYLYDQSTLSHYRSFAAAIKEKHGQHVRAFSETSEGDIVVHLSNDVDLLATKEMHVEDMFTRIESVFASPEFKGFVLEDFEYIDLRFGNKVYAKERGVTAALAQETPATGNDVASVPVDDPVTAHATTSADTARSATMSSDSAAVVASSSVSE